MANPGDECSSNGRPPNQNNPNNDDEEEDTSRPARGGPRLDLGLHIRAPGARPSAGPPMQIHWQHVQAATQQPSLPLPPQLHFRAPRPPPQPLPDMIANSDWRCSICRSPFYNKKALGGHMKVHKNRGWRGIYPPPELCQPKGLDTVTNLYPKTGNNQMLFPSHGVAIVSSNGSGGDWSGRLGAFRPWVPPVQNIGVPRVEGEGEMGRNPGKRPTPPEEQTQEGSRKSKRVRGEPVPDLNGAPPPQDDPEGGGGEGSGTAV